MRIPEEKIQEIREATDIHEVISQYVSLKKRGKSYLGLCPFHQEKTPSFSVDPVRGFYHCFGCGAGGNVFTFLMQIERRGFPEVLKDLADKAGITLPRYEDSDDQLKETEALYLANQFASEFFHHQLFETPEGKKTQAYLKRRGFEGEILKTFMIGYAPSQWDGLLKAAGKKGYSEKILLKAGLAIARKDGSGCYDRFRTRLIFPILNVSGRVTGFGGRNLKKEGSPKYLNSPETPIYQKSRLLYGLYQSKNGIRKNDKALLVEGYTDLMQLHKHGFDYGVATSGTALTMDQAKLLARYTKNVTLVYDGDSAGFAAAFRGLDILISAGLRVRIAVLPGGWDPDSLLLKKDRAAMEAVLEDSKSFVDFELALILKDIRAGTPQEKASAAHTLLETISKIPDPLERNLFIKDVSEKLEIDENLLNRQLKSPPRSSTRTESAGIRVEPITSAIQAAEEGLLFILLTEPDPWSKWIFEMIDPEDFYTSQNQKILEAIKALYLKSGQVKADILMDRFIENPGAEKVLSRLIAMDMGDDVDLHQFCLDCMVSLKMKKVQDDIHRLQVKIREEQKAGRPVQSLNKQYVRDQRKLKNIRQELNETWKKIVDI